MRGNILTVARVNTGGEVARRSGSFPFFSRLRRPYSLLPLSKFYLAREQSRQLRRLALPRELAALLPLPRVGLAGATIFRQLRRLGIRRQMPERCLGLCSKVARISVPVERLLVLCVTRVEQIGSWTQIMFYLRI